MNENHLYRVSVQVIFSIEEIYCLFGILVYLFYGGSVAVEDEGMGGIGQYFKP